MAEQISKVIGREGDQDLWRQVIAAVVRAGGRIADTGRAVGGSQEVDYIDFQLEGATLRLERETYVGMTLRGDARMLAQVSAAVVAP